LFVFSTPKTAERVRNRTERLIRIRAIWGRGVADFFTREWDAIAIAIARRAALSAVFAVAPCEHPSYRKRCMGQQHRRTVKRRRREAYLERKKVKAKTAASTRRETTAAPKGKSKKAAPAPAPVATPAPAPVPASAAADEAS
jgi:hypothetical protein